MNAEKQQKKRDRLCYVGPSVCNEFNDVIDYISLNINLLLLSWSLQRINIEKPKHKRKQTEWFKCGEVSKVLYMHILKSEIQKVTLQNDRLLNNLDHTCSQ